MNTSSSFEHWFICRKPNPHATLRLFCFPYAGGGVFPFSSWPNYLPTNVEVYFLRLPGREGRLAETPIKRLSTLNQILAPLLIPKLKQPFAFFGHSLGGLISFELAHFLLQHYGISPVHLFISGRRAPQLPNPNSPLHTLPESEFREELRRLNGTPKEVLANEELMELVSPTLRADFEMLETCHYTAKPPLQCPITAFGGLEDPEANVPELEAWRSQTTASFSLQLFPGDHFFLHTAQEVFLASLSQYLMFLTNALPSL